MSSHDVLRELKKKLQIKRMGYLGTLDPMATGVLAVFFGKGTKLIPYFSEAEKTYVATAELGKSSDTYDSTGTLSISQDLVLPNEGDLRASLESFLGQQWQIQPAFSALKFQGKRAHEYARAGEEIDLGKRAVTFHELDLLEYLPPQLSFRVHCSSGTYVRSLIHELGEKLTAGAVMTALRREQAGPFVLGDAHLLDEITEKHLLDLESFFEKYADSSSSLSRDKSYLMRKLSE